MLYVTSYMNHTGKNRVKKKVKKKKVTKNLLLGDSDPDPQNQLELKVSTLIHWTTSVNAVTIHYSNYILQVYFPFLW